MEISVETRRRVLAVLYFPLQLLIGMVVCPLIVVIFAWARSSEQAVEDVRETNPRSPEDWPLDDHRDRPMWIVRFIGLDRLMEDWYGV